jgi:glycosyltransferase involved in cell wall biosynthesis
MGSTPLISVCIPAYNNENFIAQTLASVLNQSCRDFEIIICDDRSTDATVAAITKFTDPRIRLITNESNLGIGANWNKTLALATGKYVKLICGDDVIYPECLARQLEVLENPAHSQVVLAACLSNVIDSNNGIIFRRRSVLNAGQARGTSLISSCVRWGTNLIGEPAVGLFRREVLARSGMFDPSNPYVIDLAFWAEVLKYGDAFIDRSRLAAFRISRGAVSAKVGLRQAAYFRTFVRKIRRDPAYHLSPLDMTLGYLLSLQWCVLRNFLISFRTGPKNPER